MNTKTPGQITTEYTNPVDAMSFKILNIFDVFRVNLALNNNEDSTQLVLLFVSLYKDGIINNEIINNSFSVEVLKGSVLDSELDDESKQAYLNVIEILYNTISIVISQSLDYLCFHLFQIEKELLNEYFPAIFDDTIYRIAQSQGKSGAGFIQPIELTNFMNGLVGLKPNTTIFNPFAGMASFGINLSEQQKYFGQEIDQKTWALGTLRLMAYGKLENFKFERADSIENWPNDLKFDLIVSNPPFGMRLNNRFISANPSFKSTDEFLIEKGIQSIKIGGKLIAVLSTSILFRGGSEQRLREYLVENDLIDTIISFPVGLFSQTAIPFIVMVLSKNKNLQNKVRFIKADNYVVEKSRREKVLHDELLLSVYNSDVEYSENVRLIDKATLKENDYNLSINRYFEDITNEIPVGAKLVKLGELVDAVSRGWTENETGSYINISDLAQSINDFEKQVSDFQNSNIPISSNKIDSSVLLLSKIRSLKPTYCKVAKGECVYCSNNIIPLKVDESKIYIPYLILELNSERVSRFVKSRLTGIAMPTLNKKDILEIPILLPSLEEQNAKYNGFVQGVISKKKDELNSLSKIHGLEKDIYEQNSYLRHTLAGPVSNLLGTINNLTTILEDYAKSHPDIKLLKVSEKHKLNLSDYLSNMTRDILHVSNTVGKQLKQLTSLSSSPKELIDINKFLSDYVDEFNDGSNSYKIEFSVYDKYYDDFEINTDGNKLFPFVLANNQLLTDMLNNLIENAEKHAFESHSDNRIEILLLDVEKEFTDEPTITFLVTNTGKTLPKAFTIDDFARKGNSVGANAGSGFGGWYINEIVKYFGGRIDLIDEQGREGLFGDLATSFEIELPVVYAEKL